MQLPERIQQRLSADDVPAPVYAVIGASLRLRQQVADVPDGVQARLRAARSTRDRLVTTALQVGHETRDRVAGLPAEVADRARSRWSDLLGIPAAVRGSVSDRVIDLREAASGEYAALASSGERAVAQWHAQRVLDQRADRLVRTVTPTAARAGVSARDAARKAAASPTGQRIGAAGRRARTSAQQALADYTAALDEAAAAGSDPIAESLAGARRSGLVE